MGGFGSGKPHYLNHLKEPLKSLVDVRAFGPGERIIFEPYTREMYDRAVKWMNSWGLNAEMGGKIDYSGAAHPTKGAMNCAPTKLMHALGGLWCSAILRV